MEQEQVQTMEEAPAVEAAYPQSYWRSHQLKQPFHLLTHQLKRNILDFREGQAIKLYSTLSKALYKELTDFFDCSCKTTMC